MKRAFYNGKIYLEEGKFAQAVITENGVFTHVGSVNELKPHMSNLDDMIDLGGKTVLPGFNDSHMHLYNVGLMRLILNLMEIDSISGCIAAGKKYINDRGLAPGEVVFSRGWNQDYFTDEQRPLTRHDLDKISTEHPIIAIRACGHLATCNSMALKVAGIDRNTGDIPGGEIRKDDSGEPNGILTENALALLADLKPPPSVEEMAEIIKTAMEYAVMHGITSVQTNDIRDDNWRNMLEAYNLVFNRGEGILRVYHQCCFTGAEGLKEFIAAGQRMGQGDVMHKIGPIKMFVDGSLGAHTAAMRKPYHDAPHTKGVLCMTEEELDEMVDIAHQAGFGCVIHAIGDEAIDMVLETYEKVNSRYSGGSKTGKNPLRHGVIHCQITDMPILERFKQAEVLALVQPIFLHYDMKIVQSRVGENLAETSYAFGTMNKLGVRVSYGTDAPIEDVHTLNCVHCAVNRQDLKGNPKEGFYPKEKVTPAQAVDNYTAESAYASFDENIKGRIAVGHLADMCVLDSDIFAIDPFCIKEANVDMTILGGQIVYQRQ